MNLEQFARDLNDQAVAIRREGDAPTFHNTIVAMISGIRHTFYYDGYFTYAEAKDGLLVVHLSDRQFKFRPDQLTNIVVE